MTIELHNELYLVEPCTEGFKITFPDRQEKLLYHSHDENQEDKFYFLDNHVLAAELGEAINMQL